LIICNPNTNDHVVLVDQPVGGDNNCGNRSHMYHFLRLTSSEMRSAFFDPTYEFVLFIGVNCPTVASRSDPGSHTARFWEICTRDPKSSLTSEVRQLWFLVVQRETLYGKIVTQNQFGLRVCSPRGLNKTIDRAEELLQ